MFQVQDSLSLQDDGMCFAFPVLIEFTSPSHNPDSTRPFGALPKDHS